MLEHCQMVIVTVQWLLTTEVTPGQWLSSYINEARTCSPPWILIAWSQWPICHDMCCIYFVFFFCYIMYYTLWKTSWSCLALFGHQSLSSIFWPCCLKFHC